MAMWADLDAFCAYRGRPGTSGGWDATGEKKKTINSQGFISTPELPRDKPSGRIRIAFLGGSSVAGVSPVLADEETWPWRCMERVKAELPNVDLDFLNGALAGHNSFETYGRLWSRVRFFRPDVVVVCHGWNEFYYWHPEPMARIENWRTLPDGSWSWEKTFRRVEPSWVDHVIWPSQLLVKVRYAASNRAAAAGETGTAQEMRDDFDPRAVAVHRDNLRLHAAAASALGFDLLAVEEASIVVPDLPPEWQAKCQFSWHGFDHMAHVRAYAALNGTLGEVLGEERVIRMSEVTGRTDLFHDHVHPTEAGAQAIADVVARRLVAHLKGKKQG
jgi:lysophospholipase L1-like esterase